MVEHARGADGRRSFTPEYEREQVERLLHGEVTASELSREVGISRTLLQRRKTLHTSGAATAIGGLACS